MTEDTSIYHRINIVGAAGAGTTTLGRALAKAIGIPHFEADDYLWLPTEPPYQKTRDFETKNALAYVALSQSPAFVISGSISSWQTRITDLLTLVVYLDTPTDIRLARLKAREIDRYGQINDEFIAWAAQYDQGVLAGRSRQKHESWFTSLNCPVLRLSGTHAVSHNIKAIRSSWLASVYD